MATYETLKRNARNFGRTDGHHAAAWAVPPGGWTRDAARRVLTGIEDGDPEIMDTLPWLDLSGQSADGMTDRDVLDIIGTTDATPDDWADDLINAYRDAYDAEVAQAVEEQARDYAQAVEA